MKRLFAWILICTMLCGCSPALSPYQEDGSPWCADWTAVGTVLGVSQPGYGMTLYEYNDIQGADGIYYAAWVSGEPVNITNDEGRNAELFPMQIYLLVQECGNDEEARQSAAQWRAVGESRYVMEPAPASGDFTCYMLTPRDRSPFQRGLWMLGVHGGTAISVELMCTADSTEDIRAVAADFLSCLHYRKQED